MPICKNPGKYALIDLHLHLDGSLSLDTVRALAKLRGDELNCSDEELSARLSYDESCKSLNDYLTKFDFPCSLLQTAEALTLAARALATELKQSGLIYAEIRFAPQLHTKEGLSQSEVCEAVIGGVRESGFNAGVILCCMRGDSNRDENIETVRCAAEFLGRGVVALDLAGAEALFPTECFGELFRLAKELHVPYTIHAGEASGAESVITALDLGATRIGHGVRSTENAELMSRLANSGIALELCPTSNIHTGIFSTLSDYPIKEFLSRGIAITVNTDNMTVSKTNLRAEYEALARALSLTYGELQAIATSSARAAFAPDDVKLALIEKIAAISVEND